ncbi:hypothetical protein FDI40_gp361 [Agrobacterium phage Atu_ph07]|uniref:Uncharacterized protein n=1 Tax=Agrobacterium phage Atu_ph07 TaxID=2024264 RepID=A0A2L0V027_9CAUD|nr:hypothetical protein FDI40_gp361 [Agrobacterium phage Atu_ph07]AUZ95120.1 hypothetical protein [Agrobacterium phage Atu_ph07]
MLVNTGIDSFTDHIDNTIGNIFKIHTVTPFIFYNALRHKIA